MTTAIRVDGIHKSFRIPLDRAATLKYRFTHPRSSARYRDFAALHDIGFNVEAGEFVGIIGHNGSGKSTLLKILSGIYQPDRGTVEVNGLVSPFLELGVGFNPELTARENVFLNGAILGLTRRDLQKRIDEIIAFAELEEFAQQKLKNFSSGMQVRLAFSVAIQADAGILLMDEVLAVGDARFQEKCFDVFARYKREGRTIVLVTHDLGSVNLYCDRVLLLDHGRLVADGLAADVVARYKRMVGALSDAEVGEGESNRWGSREIEITTVRLLDANGATHHTFMTGTTLIVELEYVVHDDIARDFACVLTVQRSDGLVLAEADSNGAGGLSIQCPAPGVPGKVRFTLDRLQLLEASYLVSVGLRDRHRARVYDHIEHVASFRVLDSAGRGGLVALEGVWSRGAPSTEEASTMASTS